MESSRWESLKQWYIEWSPWIAGALILFNVGFFAGVFWVGIGRFLTAPATYGWAAAVATIATVIAALRIAQNTRKEIKREAFATGRYWAARATAQIPIASGHIESAAAAFSNGNMDTTDKLNSICKAMEKGLVILEAIDPFPIYSFSPQLSSQLVDTTDSMRYLIHIIRNKASEHDKYKLLTTAQNLHGILVNKIAKMEEIATAARKAAFSALLDDPTS